MLDKISEIELAERVVNWLKEQGWEIYQEVAFMSSKIADIVAIKDNQSWVIECKTSFGLKVLEQAFDWKVFANYVSVAVPYRSIYKSKIANIILNDLKIGALLISVKGWDESRRVEEYLKPIFYDCGKINIIKYLHNEQKTWAQAGSKSGNRYTKFKGTVNQIYEYLKLHPGSTLKEIIKNIHHHYSKDSTAQSAISAWIRNGVIKNIDIKLENKFYHYYYVQNK